MAKKGFGKLVVLAAAAGAAAAGISYLRKYHSFNKELEEEFHDFEGDEEEDFFDEEDEEETVPDEEPKTSADSETSRKYISLNASTDELKVAAKDMVNAAGSVADAARNVIKDAAAILSDTAMEAASAARDTAQMAKARAAGMAESEDSDENTEEDIFQDDDEENAAAAPVSGDTDAAQKEETPDAAQPADSEPIAFSSPDPAGSGELSHEELSDDTVNVMDPEDAPKLEPEPTTVIEEIEE